MRTLCFCRTPALEWTLSVNRPTSRAFSRQVTVLIGREAPPATAGTVCSAGLSRSNCPPAGKVNVSFSPASGDAQGRQRELAVADGPAAQGQQQFALALATCHLSQAVGEADLSALARPQRLHVPVKRDGRVRLRIARRRSPQFAATIQQLANVHERHLPGREPAVGLLVAQLPQRSIRIAAQQHARRALQTTRQLELQVRHRARLQQAFVLQRPGCSRASRRPARTSAALNTAPPCPGW